MHRLWPDPDPGTALDDAALVSLYDLDRSRPWLRMNFVTSVDGAVAVDGHSAGLSGPADRRVFRLVRMLCDAVMVGAGTLREIGYRPLTLNPERRAWRRRHLLPEYPTLVVVSGRLDLDPEHPALAGAPVRPVIVTHDGSPDDRRQALAKHADVLACGDGAVDPAGARAALAERGLGQLLCEGGPRLFGALAGADVVDELCLTVSPLLTGPGAGRIIAAPPVPVGAPMPPRPLELAHVLTAGGELLLRYTRPGHRREHGQAREHGHQREHGQAREHDSRGPTASA